MIAHARNTDPSTSHLAAGSVVELTKRQDAVYRVIAEFGPMHDEELIRRYRMDESNPQQSDSGIRTRRAELVDRYLIIDSGERGKTASGRQTIVWKIYTNRHDQLAFWND